MSPFMHAFPIEKNFAKQRRRAKDSRKPRDSFHSRSSLLFFFLRVSARLCFTCNGSKDHRWGGGGVGNSMAHLMATQSVLDFGSRSATNGARAFSRVWLIAFPGYECRWRWLALVRLRPAKGFYRYEFNFRANSPLPARGGARARGRRGSGAGGPSRRSQQPALERYVPMQTCCLHRVLRARGNDGREAAHARVPCPCPGWLPVIQ